jgi:hypothetical protein
VAEGLAGTLAFLTDLCHVQAARAAGEVGRISAELVHGYNRHPCWEAAVRESAGGGVDALTFKPSDAEKAGPCVLLHEVEPFARLRLRLDACLTGSRLAKDRAAEGLSKVMIPEALDYPQ